MLSRRRATSLSIGDLLSPSLSLISALSQVQPDNGKEILGFEWLRHIDFSADETAFEPIYHAIATRQYHDHGVGKPCFCFQTARNFVAIDLRQTNVQDDQGRCWRIRLSEALHR